MTKHNAIEIATLQAVPLYRLFGWTFLGSRADGATEEDIHRLIASHVEEVEQTGPGTSITSGRIYVTCDRLEVGVRRYRICLDLAGWEEEDCEVK